MSTVARPRWPRGIGRGRIRIWLKPINSRAVESRYATDFIAGATHKEFGVKARRTAVGGRPDNPHPDPLPPQHDRRRLADSAPLIRQGRGAGVEAAVCNRRNSPMTIGAHRAPLHSIRNGCRYVNQNGHERRIVIYTGGEMGAVFKMDSSPKLWFAKDWRRRKRNR